MTPPGPQEADIFREGKIVTGTCFLPDTEHDLKNFRGQLHGCRPGHHPFSQDQRRFVSGSGNWDCCLN